MFVTFAGVMSVRGEKRIPPLSWPKVGHSRELSAPRATSPAASMAVVMQRPSTNSLIVPSLSIFYAPAIAWPFDLNYFVHSGKAQDGDGNEQTRSLGDIEHLRHRDETGHSRHASGGGLRDRCHRVTRSGQSPGGSKKRRHSSRLRIL